MQHGVGRTAHGYVERHGVLERLEARNAARQHAGIVLFVVAAGGGHDQMTGRDDKALAVGMLMRSDAISMPGVILSQLEMHTIASAQCALTMYSTLSAISSREGRL